MQTLYYNEYRAARRRIYFQAFDQTDGVTPEVGEAGVQPTTYTNGDPALNVTAGVGVLVATAAVHGAYYSELGAAQAILMVLGRHRIIADSANTGPMDEMVEVIPHPYLHDGTAQAGGASVMTLQADASAVDDVYNDGYLEILSGTGAGQHRQVVDYVGATKVATVDLPFAPAPDATSKYIITPGAKIASLATVWDALTANQNTAGSFGEVLGPIRRGVAQAGGVNTMTLDAGASAVDSYYKGSRLWIVLGQGVGQSQIISAYVGATKVATVGANWGTAPNNSSVFVILPLGVIPGAAAPTAPEVADAVWDEALVGHVLAGSFGAGTKIAAGDMSLLADAFLRRSVSGGADAFPTIEFAMCFLAGKWIDNADGTITVYKADDVTVLGTISYSTRVRDAIGGIDSAPA